MRKHFDRGILNTHQIIEELLAAHFKGVLCSTGNIPVQTARRRNVLADIPVILVIITTTLSPYLGAVYVDFCTAGKRGQV